MHLLSFLTDAEAKVRVDEHSVIHFDERLDEHDIQVEYRLLCSGMLYPSHFLSDWSKSDGARILLSMPIHLLVASQPFEDYPQELVLRFAAPLVTESNGVMTHLYHPDKEVAFDLAALLTLLCRRLVTVATKVREQHVGSSVPAILADFPVPAVTRTSRVYWRPRPIEVSYRYDGVHYRSCHPPNVPFDSSQVMHVLARLPKIKEAAAIIRAARLYASAMERIEDEPDIPYQLLISAVETLAGAALEGWEPDEVRKIASRGALISYARKTEHLSPDIAKRIALESCRDNPWSSQKFKKFLLDNLDLGAMEVADDLFIVPTEMCPKRDEIEKAIGEVYRIRSRATHSGQPYPPSAAIGPSSRVPIRAYDALINEQSPFPPIGWFERVVNYAFNGFLRSRLSL
ncbi:MAG: hypothetical protein SFX72_23225 [Isosphaeraceae bacterium]|nr:hypothetical protein [Isosphaeraceae bacterium]